MGLIALVAGVVFALAATIVGVLVIAGLPLSTIEQRLKQVALLSVGIAVARVVWGASPTECGCGFKISVIDEVGGGHLEVVDHAFFDRGVEITRADGGEHVG